MDQHHDHHQEMSVRDPDSHTQNLHDGLKHAFQDLSLCFAIDMMKMYFHGGYNEVILFDFWRISTIGGLIASMVGCFILGILYEGLKFLREFLIARELRSVSTFLSFISPSPISGRRHTATFPLTQWTSQTRGQIRPPYTRQSRPSPDRLPGVTIRWKQACWTDSVV